MNIILLIYFVLPIATIIISIALQKILKCPTLVAAIIFAIFLIVTFVINNLNFLIATIIYTIISFITAALVRVIYRIIRRFRNNVNCCECGNSNNVSNEILTINSSCSDLENRNLLTRSYNGCNGVNNDLFTISSNNTNGNNSNCNCSCNNDNNENSNCIANANGLTARINVISNSNTNGATGHVCGCYRRR